MEVSSAVFGQVVNAVLNGATRATKYLSPTVVVKATRRHKPSKRDRTVEMVLTVGRPNYSEREFIARCSKAGEPLPVKRVLLKFAKAK